MSTETNAVELRTTISVELDLALVHAVELSGVSKASFVREALALHLGAMELIPPSTATTLPIRPTSGRGFATRRKKALE